MPANEEHSVSSSRKLAAIFAADIAGYSSMMSADEDGTVRKLKAVQAIVLPIIEAHGGRIIDLAGDGILAEFPSAIRAVEAALRVQNSMEVLNAEAGPEMLFRIGVNIGDVIDDGTRLFGDGINIAARLESIAEPGGILLSRAAYDQVRDRIQIAFDDLGEHSLKNIVRPVQTFRVVRESDAKPSNVRAPLGFKDSRAVAVMPFENMSSDPAETYFVDGLTEDIITALSYWRWFPVVARNSTFAYKGKPKNVTEIGRELGAAYLVEGSARRSGEHVRITVQLVETATGHHLFAERYDRAIADVFAVQDEIAERIVASIEPEIHRAEARRAARKYPSDLDAWDCSLKALSLQERMTPSGHVEARKLLERALEFDPTSARAWSLLSLCHYHEGILGWASDRGAALRLSRDAADHAVAHDDREWLAHALWGMGRLWTERDFDSALEGEETAVALNPSAPMARHGLACIFEFSGRPAEALPHLEALLRLDPRYRFRSLAIADQSLCHLLLGNLDEAVSTAEKAVRTQTGNVRARQRLVAALSLRGLHDRARTEAAELARLQPTLDVAYIDDTYPFMLAEERDQFVNALRTSGLLK
jgi:adenylate cyclase